MKKEEFKKKKKMRRGLGTSRTTLNVPTSESKGCQKEKRKSKKFKTYLKKIMKKNFPNLAKEIDFQEVQEAQRVPKKFQKNIIDRRISLTNFCGTECKG